MSSRSRVISMSDRIKEVYAFVDLCFASLDEPDLKEIANQTRLSVSTLYRLRSHEFTLCTRIGTIQSLGYAAGFRMEWHGTHPRISLVR